MGASGPGGVREVEATRNVSRQTVLDLSDPDASNPAATGAKAANLAAALQRRLHVLPGFVLTTAAHAEFLRCDKTISPDLANHLREPWQRLRESAGPSLAVRSSSTIEDVGTSSMAGRFRSVLDVGTWPDFLSAVSTVYESAEAAASDGPAAPMAVLVQPLLKASSGGVLFGIDPVSGANHLVVEAVAGGPESIVSGKVTAQHYVLARSGRPLEVDHRPRHLLALTTPRDQLLHPIHLRRLARLAAAAAKVFGSPQDIEWAFGPGDQLWLLQSRPITAVGDGDLRRGPVLGPGPIAESFPGPLRELEADLWLGPIREAVVAAIKETGAMPPKRVAESPIVTTVRGRAAADLELFGYVPKRRTVASVLDPRPSIRRLRSAWQVGRLRVTLPALASELAAEIDQRLTRIPPLESLTERQLLAVLYEARDLLVRLHRYEILSGTLLPARSRQPTGTAGGLALAALADARSAGLPDSEIIAQHPVVLALTPPGLGTTSPLPTATSLPTDFSARPLPPREQLRLRVRWVQELGGLAGSELGRRLFARERLADPDAVASLHLAELAAAVDGSTPPTDLEARRRQHADNTRSAPLPSQFRINRNDKVIPAGRPGARPFGGVGAGGGRGSGVVCHEEPGCRPYSGRVLVVRNLDPALASALPDLAGLVAETGSTLSHLAILAREYGVPTVVAVHDAVHRFPPGVRLLVDGDTGELSLLDEVGTS